MPHPLPEKATVCTVKKEGQHVYVNCAGIKYMFPGEADVAAYLDIPWEVFEVMMEESADVLILLREKGGSWRSSRLPLE